jgi:hypothetical protein
MQPVPSQFNLRRQSIALTTVTAAEVNDTETRHNQSSTATEHNQSLSMATQTMPTVMAAAALTLANTKPGKVHSFFRPGKGLSGGSGGHRTGGPPEGPPGGPGTIFAHPGARGAGGGRSKLGGNLPAIFDGD